MLGRGFLPGETRAKARIPSPSSAISFGKAASVAIRKIIGKTPAPHGVMHPSSALRPGLYGTLSAGA